MLKSLIRMIKHCPLCITRLNKYGLATTGIWIPVILKLAWKNLVDLCPEYFD